jgi:hypothetical protein
MTIRIGSTAPDFEGESTAGSRSPGIKTPSYSKRAITAYDSRNCIHNNFPDVEPLCRLA